MKTQQEASCLDKVFFCDDEPKSPAVSNIIESLERSGYKVDIAVDLFQAHGILNRISKGEVHYRYLLLDLKGKDKNDPYEFLQVFDYLENIVNPPEVLVISAYLGDLTSEVMSILQEKCKKIFSKDQADQVIKYIIKGDVNKVDSALVNTDIIDKDDDNTKEDPEGENGILKQSSGSNDKRYRIDFNIPGLKDEKLTIHVSRAVSWCILVLFAVLVSTLIWTSVTVSFKIGQLTEAIKSDEKQRSLVLSNMRDLVSEVRVIASDMRIQNQSVINELKLMREKLDKALVEKKKEL